MPDYKHRRINLAPKRQEDGTWRCPYTIIEFRPTCWAYRKGCPDALFPSHEEAEAAALEEAKRIVDALDPHAPLPLSNPPLIGGRYGLSMRRLTFSIVQGIVYIGQLVVFSLQNWRKALNTIMIFAWSRR